MSNQCIDAQHFTLFIQNIPIEPGNSRVNVDLAQTLRRVIRKELDDVGACDVRIKMTDQQGGVYDTRVGWLIMRTEEQVEEARRRLHDIPFF